MSMQEKYLAEYEKYKHIQIFPGFYLHKRERIQFEIIKVEDEKVLIKTIKSGNIHYKTLHWCRKNLIPQTS